MVTASAPVPVDPHGPIATAQTTPAAVPALGTFQSIYQNLPTGEGPANLSQILLNSKDAGQKRNPKSTDDQLPLTALFTQTVDSPLRLPWAPPSLNLSTAAPAPTAKENSQAAASVAGDVVPSEAASSLAQAGANAIPSIGPQKVTLQDAVGKAGRTIASAKSTIQHLSTHVALPNFGLADGHHAGLSLTPSVSNTAPTPTPGNGKPQGETPRGALTSAMAQHAAESVSAINKGIAESLGPRSESLAFSLRLVQTEAGGKRVQAAAQAEAPRGQSHNDSKNEEQGPSATTAAAATVRGESLTSGAADVAARATSMQWSEPAAISSVAVRSEVEVAQPREATHTSVAAAIHEIQPAAPEAPRSSAAGEILLQLGSKEQPASIRVSDRGGAVNVTVHAADPDLRSSLRSNLGDLASQLSHQGWKAEVVKTGTILTRTETPQDQRQDGGRSPGQQQSFTQGDRQQGRERRANSNQWLNEFEEQTSGSAGGTR